MATLPCSLLQCVFAHAQSLTLLGHLESKAWVDCARTTKCLNTGVILCSLFLSQRIYEQCDNNDVVRRRRRAGAGANARRMKAFVRGLSASSQVPLLYYVILTDGFFTCKDGARVFFPGHVFVIEQIPRRRGFVVFQTYINEYSARDDRSCKYMRHADIAQFFQLLAALFDGTTPVWTRRTAALFASLTGVASAEWIGCAHDTNLEFRAAAISKESVLRNMDGFLRKWQARVAAGPDKLVCKTLELPKTRVLRDIASIRACVTKSYTETPCPARSASRTPSARPSQRRTGSDDTGADST